MLRPLTVIFLLITFPVCSYAQIHHKPKPKPVKSHSKTTKVGIGLGLTRSVLYLSRNVKENNDANGFHVSMVYGGSRLIRANAEYTYYRPIDIAPTWYRIHAQTLELNMHILAKFQNSGSYFYPVFGASYNVFTGYFTGINDFLNLGSKHKSNQDVSTRWLGLNTGLGYEYFYKKLGFYIEYKMRTGFTEVYKQLTIMDVCISCGLRYTF